MDFVDLIEKKKQGKCHTKEEIRFLVSSLMCGQLSDSQLASWLMAINFKSLTDEEMLYLSEAIVSTGKCIDFSELQKKVTFISSTGGVGDKVNLALIPLLSACEVPVLLLSDRGSYQSSIDKIESIPMFNTRLNSLAIVNQMKNLGCVISSLDEGLVPAANKLSLIESATATADSDVLIASTIISYILVSGTSNAVIDLRYGNGAIIKTVDEAERLASQIITLAKILNKDITIVISLAEEPFGRFIGNSLEVIESIEFLKGNIDNCDFSGLTYYTGAITLYKAGTCNSIDEGIKHLKSVVSSGKAIDRFKELVAAQGGDVEVVDNYDKFVLPCYKVECESKKSGYVQNIDAAIIRRAAKELGVVRDNFSYKVDYAAGIYLNKKCGEYVEKGDILYTIYSNDEDKTKKAQNLCDFAYTIGDTKPSYKSLVQKVIGIEEDDV